VLANTDSDHHKIYFEKEKLIIAFDTIKLKDNIKEFDHYCKLPNACKLVKNNAGSVHYY